MQKISGQFHDITSMTLKDGRILHNCKIIVEDFKRFSIPDALLQDFLQFAKGSPITVTVGEIQSAGKVYTEVVEVE